MAERRALVNGAVEYVRAEQLRMGEEIFYTVRVRNATNAAIQEPTVVKSIPRNTRFVANSAAGPAADVDYSVDGGATFAGAGQLIVRTATGGMRPARPEDFSTIRWRLRHPLASGATALLRFRAVFE